MSTHNALGNRIDDTSELDNGDVAEHAAIGTRGGWQFSRYDLLLFLLPLPLALGLGWATMTAAPMSAGVSLGSVPTLALLGYSLFIGGPTTSDTDALGEYSGGPSVSSAEKSSVRDRR